MKYSNVIRRLPARKSATDDVIGGSVSPSDCPAQSPIPSEPRMAPCPPPDAGSYRDVLNRINDRLDECRTAMDDSENRASAAECLRLEAAASNGRSEHEA